MQRIPGRAAAAVPFWVPLGETIYMTEHIHDHDALDDACAVAHGADTLDASCEVAHGTEPAPIVSSVPGERILVAVFASPVSGFLLRYAADLGYRGFLVEPDEGRAAGAAALGFPMLSVPPEDLSDSADVIVTDHHREELGLVLRDMLATKARWIGVLGNRWHVGPHIEMLSELGVPPEDDRPRAPADRAQHRLEDAGRDRHLGPGRAGGRAQRPPRRIRVRSGRDGSSSDGISARGRRLHQ